MEALIHKGPYKIDKDDQEHHPFCAIGIVISRMNKPAKKIFGTGCLIGPDQVLTCAHNCFDRLSEKMFDSIEFIPAPIYIHTDRGYRVIEKYVPEQYMKSNYFEPDAINQGNLIDYALLLLDTEGDNL